MSLTDLTSVKNWLGISTTTNDAILSSLITVADDICKAYVGRDLEQATYTDIYDGQGQVRLFLKQRPIVSVTSVTINRYTFPTVVPNFSVNNVTGWDNDDKSIWLVGYKFNSGNGNIKIVYQAGYNPLPADVKQAALITVQGLYESQGVDPNAASESVPGAIQVVYRTPAGSLPSAAALLLNKYKRVSV